MNQWPRSNMPHLKRIINQQVFLEESDPYITADEARRNQYAMEAASQMIQGIQPSGLPMDISQLAMDNIPYPDGGAMFQLPRNSAGGYFNNQYNTLAPNMTAHHHQPTSYMTQGQYSQHPIFHT